ncbi:MAG: hypothetical protein JWP44_3538 [Mucilaginibacter sp.]|nr:hypothetical protein [Mucilaginibacter sp.]
MEIGYNTFSLCQYYTIVNIIFYNNNLMDK